MAITYTFVVRSVGTPTAGLTPAFTLYRDASSLADLAPVPVITEIGSGHYRFTVDWNVPPQSTGPSNSITTVIDAGAGIADANERYITGRINRSDEFTDVINAIQTDTNSIEAKVDIVDLVVDSIQVDTNSIEAKVDIIDTTADAILVDTGTDIPANMAVINGKVDVLDTNVDSILVDTGTTLPAQLTVMETKIDTVDTVVDLLQEVETGMWEVTADGGGTFRIFKSDGVTLVKEFELFDIAGLRTTSAPASRVPI